jgi:hypothetical protein
MTPLTKCQLQTRGPRPNTGILLTLGDVLTETGRVKVKPTLQLPSYDDIFALGDIIDWPEQKQAAKVYGHANVVAANVLSVLEGREPKSVYKGAYEMIVITNGKVSKRKLFTFDDLANRDAERWCCLFRSSVGATFWRLAFATGQIEDVAGAHGSGQDGHVTWLLSETGVVLHN